MSNTQRETISYWTGIFSKMTIALCGALLLLLYYDIRDDAVSAQKTVIEINSGIKEINKSVNQIENRVNIIEYRLNKDYVDHKK
jgi:hypothetical protein